MGKEVVKRSNGIQHVNVIDYVPVTLYGKKSNADMGVNIAAATAQSMKMMEVLST